MTCASSEKLTPALPATSRDLIQRRCAAGGGLQSVRRRRAGWLFTNARMIPVFVDHRFAFQSKQNQAVAQPYRTLKPANRFEAEILTGIKVENKQDVVRTANALHEQGYSALPEYGRRRCLLQRGRAVKQLASKPFQCPTLSM